jgi:hypothetical protein
MKKLLIVLAVLLIAGAGAFADVTVSGGASGGFVLGFSPLSATGSMEKAEINLSAAVSDNTSVSIQLDNNEGAPWDSTVLIDDWRITSNIFAELGLSLPVSASVTFGYFDTYLTNWTYATKSSSAFADGWGGTAAGYLLATQPSDYLAWQWTIGFGDFSLMWWNNWYFNSIAVAFKGSVADMISFIAGYRNPLNDTTNNGTIWAEVSANLDLGVATLFIPATVSIGLTTGATAFSWSSGVKAGIADMVTVGVGVGGDTAATAFQYIIPEVTATPLAGLSVYANGMIILGGTSAFKSVDLGVTYAFGPFTLNPGFVIGIDSTYSTALVDSGEIFGVPGTGAYVIMSVSF